MLAPFEPTLNYLRGQSRLVPLLSSHRIRKLSSQLEPEAEGDRTFSAWRIRDYGGISALKREDDLQIPLLTHPNQLLVSHDRE